MPELPEVETIVRQLAPLVRGRRLLGLEILDNKLELPRAVELTGSTTCRTLRLGKRVALELELPDGVGVRWLAFHLRMTGRLVWLPGNEKPPPRHLRAALRFEGGSLLFHDIRRFGTLTIHDELSQAAPAGLDPLAEGFTVEALGRLLAHSPQQIKVWLLRQDRLSGLGNIYASEILHAAGINPHAAAGALTGEEVERLHRATLEILRRAVESRGTTFSDYRDAGGERGGFQELLQVYGRGGESCPRCGGEILRCVQCQRSTFYCPTCQSGGPTGR